MTPTQTFNKPYGVIEAEQRARDARILAEQEEREQALVLEERLQQLREAQIACDDDDPTGAAKLDAAVRAFDYLPPCGRCGQPILDVRDAIVSKKNLAAPSRILHGVCFGEEVRLVTRVLMRGGSAGRALGVDVL